MSVAASLRRIANTWARNAVLPATPAAIEELERAIGGALPADVRAAWAEHGGQRVDNRGIIAGFVLLSPAQSLAEWRTWEELRREQTPEALEELSSPCTSSPAQAIAEDYTNPGWIPLWKELHEGNYLGVDLAPGPAGRVGQVIHFGRDEDDKVVLFWSYAAALAWLADELEKGGPSGRILSLLKERALRGELPMGDKPAPAKAMPKRAKATATSKKTDPVAVPEKLPDEAQKLLEAIIESLSQSLTSTAPSARSALSHQALDDDRKPLQSAMNGSVLDVTPDDDDDFDFDRKLGQKYRDVFQRSLDGGLPLHQIEVRFVRDARGAWTHAVALETAENFERRNAALKGLAEEIRVALIAFIDRARPEWESATLNFEDYPNARRPGLCAVSARPKPLVDLAPDAALKDLFAKVVTLYGVFGRRLVTASFRVEKNKPSKIDVTSYYG